MNILKKIGTGILIVLLLFATVADVTYLLICLFGEEKSVSFTLKGGTLNGVDDTDLKFIFNFRYFRNSDNSGKEMFEMRLNSFVDEETNEVYSTGIQLVSPSFNYAETKINDWISNYYEQDVFFAPYFQYNMYDDISYVAGSYTPEEIDKTEAINRCRFLFEKDFYTITVGQDIFKMTFKDEFEVIGYKQSFPLPFKKEIKRHNNFAYFLAKMYEDIKYSKLGENQTVLFKFVDHFNFQLYDKETGQYGEILKEGNTLSKVTKHLQQYFAVKIDCYDYGVTKASESMFGCVNGTYNYNTSDENLTEDYLIGYSIIKLNERHFEFAFDYDANTYYIKLKDSIKDYYNELKNIAFDISINMTLLNSLDVYNFEISKDKLNLGNAVVYQFTKYTTNSAGEKENVEVVYVE